MERSSGSGPADFILETSSTLCTSCSTSDMIARSDTSCDRCNAVINRDTELVASTPHDTHRRISTCTLQSASESLPSLLTQNNNVSTSCMSGTLSLPSSPESLPSCGNCSSAEMIPSSEVSTMVIGDCGIPDNSCETCVSLSQRNLGMSDLEAAGEVNVGVEPLCRICQLPGDSATTSVRSSVISPCRCAGSLQYTHTACLVVSEQHCTHTLHTAVVFTHELDKVTLSYGLH